MVNITIFLDSFVYSLSKKCYFWDVYLWKLHCWTNMDIIIFFPFNVMFIGPLKGMLFLFVGSFYTLVESDRQTATDHKQDVVIAPAFSSQMIRVAIIPESMPNGNI